MAAKRRYSLNDEELTALESYLAASLTPMSPRPAFVNALNSRLASPSEPGVWLEQRPSHLYRNLLFALLTIIGVPLVFISGRRGVHLITAALRQWRTEPAI